MRIFKGKVISNKMVKTAVVEVKRVWIHPLYRKKITRTKRYHVHDQLGTKMGDQVEFVSCRPFSKTKKWKITKVL